MDLNERMKLCYNDYATHLQRKVRFLLSLTTNNQLFNHLLQAQL